MCKYIKISIIALLAVYIPSLGAKITTFRSIQHGAVALDAGRMSEAVAWYNRAVVSDPKGVIAQRGLARAKLASGDAPAAVAVLEIAWRLQPDSLLVQQELAEAYMAVGEVQYADELWAKLGVTSERMAALGDEYLALNQFSNASVWYTQSIRHNPAPAFDLRFRQMVAAIRAGQPSAQDLLLSLILLDASFKVYLVADNSVIDGSDLRWMTAFPDWQIYHGRPLAIDHVRPLGFFWWTGEATLVVTVEEDGLYQVQVRVRHSDPPPVEMAMGINGHQMIRPVLTRGDNSWETVTFTANLEAGLHTIDIWFLNNAIIETKDRDAVVETIAFKSLSE